MPQLRTLPDLPNELLNMIMLEFGDRDLLDYVCFALLSTRTRACYSDEFWASICRAHGLGRLSGETKSWFAIAVECARHAQWSCGYLACDQKQLKTNREPLGLVEPAVPVSQQPFSEAEMHAAGLW